MHVYVGARGCQKKVPNPLDLQAVVSSDVGAGNQTPVLGKSNNYSYPLSYLSSPHPHILYFYVYVAISIWCAHLCMCVPECVFVCKSEIVIVCPSLPSTVTQAFLLNPELVNCGSSS